jgi:dienelactone hydrolase
VSVSPERAGLIAFLAELRDAGYAPDPSQAVAIEHLLLLVAAGAWPRGRNDLGSLLAPVIAHTPTQQADILQRVARWSDVLLTNGSLLAVPPQSPLLPVRAPKLASLRAGAIDSVTATVKRRRLTGRLRILRLPVGFIAAIVAVGFGGAFLWYRWVMVGQADAPDVFSYGERFFTIFRSSPQTLETQSQLIPISTSVLFGFLSLLTFIIFRRWVTRHRGALGAQASRKPRDLAELNILVSETPLFEGLVTDLASLEFARPRRLVGQELDVEQSLKATAYEAGLIQVVYQERRSTPSYVVLVEEVSRHDHLARLADRLVDRMCDAGVQAERYYIVNPQVIHDSTGRTETLEEISRRHSDQRLLVVGPGEAINDTYGAGLIKALKEDAPWSDRSYLVAGRIDARTVRRLTAESFSIATTTPTGVSALGQYVAGATREGGIVLLPLPGVHRDKLLPKIASQRVASRKKLKLTPTLQDFRVQEMEFLGKTRPVLMTGEVGPAIIVLHEVTGFTSRLARLCRWIRDAGFRVYVPIIFGAADDSNADSVALSRIAHIFFSRDFTPFSQVRSRHLVLWLQEFATQAHAECGGPGVGAIGLSLTGILPLAMATEPVVVAAVLGQPAWPQFQKAAIGLTAAELTNVTHRANVEGLKIRGYRFAGDPFCSHSRFETLRKKLGDAFTGVELPDASGSPSGAKLYGKPPHSIFTFDLEDTPGSPTRAVVDDVIRFFIERLSSGKKG